MDKGKEFAKNTAILFVGKFCTQFISLLLLPLYTHYLISSDYGLVDLLQTYIALFAPVFCLRLDSAVFRFLLDKRNDNEEKTNIISNSLITISLISIFLIVIGALVVLLFDIKYGLLMIANIVVLMFSNVILQIARGIGKVKDYSIASIITGVSTLLVNILLIVYFGIGGKSILISACVANLLCCVYLLFKDKIYKYISIASYKKERVIELLKYSLPMIPNALSWWVVGVSDRTIISFFINTAANGIYSVSCKFSNIINSVFSIFSMSWQETASLHIDDEDRDLFFSNMINKMLTFFASVSLLAMCYIPVFFDILIGNEYLESYNYIPILIFANIFNIFIGLAGGIYVAKKKTKEIANTTIISAIINLIVNVALIKFIGLYAACLSTLVAYLTMSIYRYFDIKKYVKLKLDIKKLGILFTAFMISSLLYYNNQIAINLVNMALGTFVVLVINLELIHEIVSVVIKKLRK